MQTNKKKLWILLGALAVIIVIIVIATSKSQKTANNNQPGAEGTPGANVNEAGEPSTPGAADKTGTSTTVTAGTPAPITFVSKKELAEAKAVVPGANLVTKGTNKVINEVGAIVSNSGVPNTPNTVHQTALIAAPADLPAEVVKVGISTNGFSPKTFTVKPNVPLTLAFSATDSSPHTIVFDSPELSAVGVGIGPGGTRAVTFSAPTKPGNYTFRCGYPDHAERGEVGTMIVK